MGHPGPVINGIFTDSVCSFLPYHGPREPVPVPGCCIGPYYFTIKLDEPGHGSRSRLGLPSRDFKDPGACLCHHTLNRACRSIDHAGYISTLLLMGKGII